MAKSYEEMTTQERLDAALAIIALDFAGQLKAVQKELGLDSKTVNKIKQQALEALEKAFSNDDEEDEPTFEINILEGLSRVKQLTPSLPPRTRRSVPDLTEDQIGRIRVIFTDLEEFNKKQPATKKLKPTEGLLKSALDYFGMPAEVVINKLPKIMKDKIAATDEAFKKHYVDGKYPKRPNIDPFLNFLKKKYPDQQQQEDDQQDE
jgi:hypothetical protein